MLGILGGRQKSILMPRLINSHLSELERCLDVIRIIIIINIKNAPVLLCSEADGRLLYNVGVATEEDLALYVLKIKYRLETRDKIAEYTHRKKMQQRHAAASPTQSFGFA